MTEEFLRAYTRNQLFINPKYSGELLTIKGKQYETDSTVSEITKDGSINTTGDKALEISMAFIISSPLYINLHGRDHQLGDLIKSFSDQMPVKYRADDALSKLTSSLIEMIKPNILLNQKEYIIDHRVLRLKDKSYDNVENALRELFGLGKLRFVKTLSGKTNNGNLLDFQPNTYKQFSSCTLPITKPSNAIRAMGCGYTDYRNTVNKGFLTSYDKETDNVYVADFERLYCISTEEYATLLRNNDTSTIKSDRVFVLEDLEKGNYIRLENIKK